MQNIHEMMTVFNPQVSRNCVSYYMVGGIYIYFWDLENFKTFWKMTYNILAEIHSGTWDFSSTNIDVVK